MFLNSYGDHKLDTTGTHGTDIAAQRIDDLDLACLEFILTGAPPQGVALDLGSGAGYHTLRMAALGMNAMSVDLLDLTAHYELVKQAFPTIALSHTCGRIEDFAVAENKVPLSLLYSQRTFHYLPFAESARILRELHDWTAPGAKAFVSVSGLGSELGEGYAHKRHDVADRWAPLDRSMADKHGILERVCLYREDDLDRLAKRAGFSCSHIWSSDFGNVKAILKRE